MKSTGSKTEGPVIEDNSEEQISCSIPPAVIGARARVYDRQTSAAYELQPYWGEEQEQVDHFLDTEYEPAPAEKNPPSASPIAVPVAAPAITPPEPPRQEPEPTAEEIALVQETQQALGRLSTPRERIQFIATLREQRAYGLTVERFRDDLRRLAGHPYARASTKSINRVWHVEIALAQCAELDKRAAHVCYERLREGWLPEQILDAYLQKLVVIHPRIPLNDWNEYMQKILERAQEMTRDWL